MKDLKTKIQKFNSTLYCSSFHEEKFHSDKIASIIRMWPSLATQFFPEIAALGSPTIEVLTEKHYVDIMLQVKSPSIKDNQTWLYLIENKVQARLDRLQLLDYQNHPSIKSGFRAGVALGIVEPEWCKSLPSWTFRSYAWISSLAEHLEKGSQTPENYEDALRYLSYAGEMNSILDSIRQHFGLRLPRVKELNEIGFTKFNAGIQKIVGNCVVDHLMADKRYIELADQCKKSGIEFNLSHSFSQGTVMVNAFIETPVGEKIHNKRVRHNELCGVEIQNGSYLMCLDSATKSNDEISELAKASGIFNVDGLRGRKYKRKNSSMDYMVYAGDFIYQMKSCEMDFSDKSFVDNLFKDLDKSLVFLRDKLRV